MEKIQTLLNSVNKPIFCYNIYINKNVGENMYRALYRQYRSKTFDEVLGQKHITTTLKNQIKKENIGHAYLFSGTRGTGKTSTAKIFSRAVNCLNIQDGNPCNECKICKGIFDESNMDVIEMDAASNRRIDDIRDLKDKVIYPPSMSKFKVYIIDEVHMLTTEAFNALLKTLEEPPKHLIFILATTEPEKLPQTILSRCQRFDFKRITIKDMVENMENICKDLDITIDSRVLNLIARNSDGAMRDALSLMEQCISSGNKSVSYEEAINILGIVNSDSVINITEKIINKDLESLLKLIDEIIQNGKDMHQFLKDLIDHFRNLMITKTSKNPMELLDLDEETMQRYIDQSKDINIEFILKGLDILTNADERMKWSTNPRIILEMASVQLFKVEESFSLEERIKRLEQGIKTDLIYEKPAISKSIEKSKETKKEEKPIDKEEKTEEKPVYINDGSSVTIEQIQNDWKEILQIIKSIKVNVYALLMEGKPVAIVNDIIHIGYKTNFGIHKAAISSPVNHEIVKTGISSFYKKNLDVKFIMETDKITTKEDESKKNETAIKEVINFFGENIVEIK